MAYMSITSANKDFSYVLRKNPTSGMLIKSCRRGYLYGWFSEENRYNIFFKDAYNESSYSDTEFEYLDLTRYTSPLFVLDVMSNMLYSAVKQPEEHDISCESSIELGYIYTKEKYVNVFRKSFPWSKWKILNATSSFLQLRITGESRLQELLNLVALFALFSAKQFHRMELDQAKKYVDIMKYLQAPYIVRYMFKMNGLMNQKLFKECKEGLETLLPESEKDAFFVSGSANDQRRNFVREYVQHQNHTGSILDVGCGEGQYLFALAPKIGETKKYIGVDIDESLVEFVQKKVEKRGIENAEVFSSLDDSIQALPKDDPLILLIEVIEHMPLEEATQLLHRLLDVPSKGIILTTPNKTFNTYYQIEETEDGEEGMRHDDHHFEMTKEEMQNWLSQFPVEYTMYHIGDQVNGESAQHCVVIKTKKGD